MRDNGRVVAAVGEQGIEQRRPRILLDAAYFDGVFRIQSGTKRICSLSSFINLDFTSSAG